jgi:hypothetical protein
MIPISGNITDSRITPTTRDSEMTSVGSRMDRQWFRLISISS